MKTEIKDISPTRKQIDIEIEPQVVRAAYDRISDRYARLAKVPGFRPGHAPRSVVRTRFKDQIRGEVLQELMPEAVQKAIAEHQVAPLGEPELNVESVAAVDLLSDQPISFHVEMDVLADFDLGNYKGIEVTRRTRPVTDEDVDRVLEKLRDNSASLQPVEDRGAELGDTVSANFHGTFVNDPEAEPINVEEVDVELGGQGVVPEITDHLLGCKPDDEKTFIVNYPADFTSKGLAGKQIEYLVKLNAVRVKELPELDDEWAQSLGETVDSLATLRSRIKADLEQRAGDEADAAMRADLVHKLVAAHQFELPERLVEHQTERRFQSMLSDLTNRGIDTRAQQINWEGARASLREQATQDLRGSLLLERVADEEKIEVTPQEIDDEINAIADASHQTPAQVRAVLTKQNGERSIADRLRNGKALDLIVSHATVADEAWKEENDGPEAEKDQE
jgi:trigger factor